MRHPPLPPAALGAGGLPTSVRHPLNNALLTAAYQRHAVLFNRFSQSVRCYHRFMRGLCVSRA